VPRQNNATNMRGRRTGSEGVDERRLWVDRCRRDPDDVLRVHECGCMLRDCGSGVFMYVRFGERVAWPRNGATCRT
jgi:hypothetical protein